MREQGDVYEWGAGDAFTKGRPGDILPTFWFERLSSSTGTVPVIALTGKAIPSTLTEVSAGREPAARAAHTTRGT